MRMGNLRSCLNRGFRITPVLWGHSLPHASISRQSIRPISCPRYESSLFNRHQNKFKSLLSQRPLSQARIRSLSTRPNILDYLFLKLNRPDIFCYEGEEISKLPDYNYEGWAYEFKSLMRLEKYSQQIPKSDEIDAKIQQAIENYIDSMVRSGFDVNREISLHRNKKETKIPIHNAVKEGCPIILRSLIKHGAKVNAYDEMGRTPLYLAAWLDRLVEAKILVQRGANVNQPTKLTFLRDEQISPLPINAAASPEMCIFLAKHGSDVNAKSDVLFQESALHRNADLARPRTIAALFQLGAKDFYYPGRGTALNVARTARDLRAEEVTKEEFENMNSSIDLLENPSQASRFFSFTTD